ncbi:MAG: hypothetical protein H7838_12785, partial [Magnetococcus sp. DMHC-8]
ARHQTAIPMAFRLQEIYMALSTLLLSTLDHHKVAQIAEWVALAHTIVAAQPVPVGDPLYHSTQFYLMSIDAINIQAVTQPMPPPAPWPAIEFASATGQAMDSAAVRAYVAARQPQLIFYSAADPVYVTRHARRYVSTLLQRCDVPFLVIVQVIGGMGRLPEMAHTIGIDDPHLILAADDFQPDTIRAITWKINEPTPIRTPLVYYQSARFLWLGYLLEQFNTPVIVADIDQLLQRGLRDLLEGFAQCDVVFHERPHGVKIADRLIANLLLVYPTATGRLFTQFFRYYLGWALQNAEHRGAYAYFLDQCALLMARHHLLWMGQPRLDRFAKLDINTGMYGAYEENPFRFFSFYSGFDMASLPEAPRGERPNDP